MGVPAAVPGAEAAGRLDVARLHTHARHAAIDMAAAATARARARLYRQDEVERIGLGRAEGSAGEGGGHDGEDLGVGDARALAVGVGGAVDVHHVAGEELAASGAVGGLFTNTFNSRARSGARQPEVWPGAILRDSPERW